MKKQNRAMTDEEINNNIAWNKEGMTNPFLTLKAINLARAEGKKEGIAEFKARLMSKEVIFAIHSTSTETIRQARYLMEKAIAEVEKV